MALLEIQQFAQKLWTSHLHQTLTTSKRETFTQYSCCHLCNTVLTICEQEQDYVMVTHVLLKTCHINVTLDLMHFNGEKWANLQQSAHDAICSSTICWALILQAQNSTNSTSNVITEVWNVVAVTTTHVLSMRAAVMWAQFYFSLSSVVSRTFSAHARAMCVFDIRSSSSPLRYSCAKFRFCRDPQCWASMRSKIV